MSYSYPFYGQQPYPYQDQLGQLRTAPMFQPPVQQRQDNSALNWVQGEAGAKSWFVAPGATVLLMDSETQRFYLKTADAGGIPTMRTFEYAEVGAVKPAAAVAQPDFVTADEFEQFKKSIENKLQELAEPVEVSLTRKKKGESNE